MVWNILEPISFILVINSLHPAGHPPFRSPIIPDGHRIQNKTMQSENNPSVKFQPPKHDVYPYQDYPHSNLPHQPNSLSICGNSSSLHHLLCSVPGKMPLPPHHRAGGLPGHLPLSPGQPHHLSLQVPQALHRRLSSCLSD